jgi:hypothetical protein
VSENLNTEQYADGIQQFDLWQSSRSNTANRPALSVDQFLKWQNEQSFSPSSETVASLKSPDIDNTLRQREQIVRREEMAALVGRFHPEHLVKDTPEDLRQAILSQLAAVCSVESHTTELQWMLLHARRRELLGRLIDQGRLVDALHHNLPATDRFGELLQKVLERGQKFTIDGLSLDDLSVLAVVVEAISGIPAPVPNLSDIRLRLAQASRLDDQDVLLSKGFVGRKAELQQLHDFLLAPKTTTFPATLLLTGLGGAGKSTLVTQFVREVMEKSLATVVILDFDRPGITIVDTTWLEAEIARQVGQQYPQLLERLRQARQDVRDYKGDASERFLEHSFESIQGSRTSAVLRLIQKSTAEIGVQDRPFLVVLDTFEEIEQFHDQLSTFESWLYFLEDCLSPMPLKIIISGRSVGSVVEEHWAQQHMTIDELETPLARKLLIQLGVREQTARRLVASKVLPRRPLELKLLASIMTDAPGTSVAGLEREIRQIPAARGKGDSVTKPVEQLATGVIYRRVLNRLKDPITKRLAYPGLVLRYVTVDLVQQVLAPVLELSISDDEAQMALKELASHAWLTYRQQDQIWHRKDLRRMMIRLLESDQRTIADNISRKAIEYFSAGSTTEDFAEAMYHRLMLTRTPEDGQSLELPDLKLAVSLIGNDADDLPQAAATLLRFAKDGRVPVAEVELLPPRYLPKAYRRTGQRLVNGRDYGSALRLYERGVQDGLSVDWNEDTVWPWEVEALYATARWKDIPVFRDEVGPTEYLAAMRSLYPAEVISQSRLSAIALREAFESTDLRDRIGLHVDYSMIDGVRTHKQFGAVLSHVSMALILLNDRDPLPTDLREVLINLARTMIGSTDRILSSVLQRRLVQLQRALGDEQPLTFYLGLSGCRMDVQWLETVGEFIRNSPRPTLGKLLLEAHDTLKGVLSSRRSTVRRVLTAFDALNKKRDQWYRLPIVLHPDKHADILPLLLRGSDSEFRDPCRFAISEACQTRAARMQLAEIISSILKFSPPDLQAETFADLIEHEAERGLEPYLEFLDRAGLLGVFMERLLEEFPEAAKLSRVHKAWLRWDTVLRSVIYTI